MLLILVACAPVSPAYAKPAPAPAPAPGLTMGEVVRLHMSEHLAKAIDTRDAVIHGDLARARSDLSWMASHEEPESLLAAGPWIEALHSAARAGYQGHTAREYALAVGREGAACAGCHGALGVALSPVAAARPTVVATEHAALADWAVDSMWTGLISNSAPTWTAGATALASLPTESAAYGVGTLGPAATAAMVTLREQATAAPSAIERVSRGEAFGQVVGACGSCHAEMGAISK